MKDRLIELFQQADKKYSDTKQCENCVGFGNGNECVDHLIADHLLANGVIVPPVKVGQTVWIVTHSYNVEETDDELKVYECRVSNITFYSDGEHQIRLYHGDIFVACYIRAVDIGKTVFLTREEAEKALAERRYGNGTDTITSQTCRNNK